MKKEHVHIQEPFFWNYHKCYEGYPHNVSKPLNVYHLFEVCVWIYIDPPYTHTHTHTNQASLNTGANLLGHAARILLLSCSLGVQGYPEEGRSNVYPLG